MQQSSFNSFSPLHAAIILDGNGRWAQNKGWPRVAGHQSGAKTVRTIVEAAPDAGIGTLTLYAFSSDNWRRPGYEVKALMKLFSEYLKTETPRCLANDVRLSIIGRRDRFSDGLRAAIVRAEQATLAGKKLHLRVALDYSARDMILEAARQLHAFDGDFDRETFSRLVTQSDPVGERIPDVDILIRTGGEQRLSDFLLWECAYAEFFFVEKMWPDFSPADLQQVVGEFCSRDRRFGGLNQLSQQVVAG
ncbi:di-trans,poly-cis-decaprenylcistransferase [bacterium (Candidatus Blackallbacteria) CG17_big_fil_post_rev_8_21_14_2_50_48_46]|uniref:Isoprenyl transferase n=1 Tax=bacterium (Candidatus Blackallbacteria) CG17_big_fil_post_rev_8_21_14_2_50_48_46 TaxID=2014261 RepID=A0A2M7G9E5_9BACT|nr:MAG: di-trans,poly-cis-decaprenylcistransferase [bacterium (Candidatus Blackallbacteria) CG18_big_fil_WC_8_21_14_2_50_49_26]PIW18729.1 MAG: di-trans,poly-cis-decaprenylcistransferase [bacterium (Candidatus Blackallbacteria) CG17_big_fil_post_rev_8_21_14_2_50_48_46]PIW46600.1 MAG: di-trans,poly-cis-decaprenylcistransferase [bacterium (Candidatus Blackallbacteria) CG13_big_fil_rev_8_21_14_2_50_49_14]